MRICLRCGHQWIRHFVKLPKKCPKCNLPSWNTHPKVFRDLPGETWFPIPIAKGYLLSNQLRIKRLATPNIRRGNCKYDYILKPGRLINSGYLVVRITLNGKSKGFLLHQLVASVHLGSCPKGHEVNHKNGVKTDNQPENLEYVTHKLNQEHASKMGRFNKGSQCHQAKLTEDQVKEILMNAKIRQDDFLFAKKFNVHPATINRVRRRKIWLHVTVPLL